MHEKQQRLGVKVGAGLTFVSTSKASRDGEAKMGWGPIYSTTTDPNVHKFNRARWSHLHTTTTHLAAAGHKKKEEEEGERAI